MKSIRIILNEIFYLKKEIEDMEKERYLQMRNYLARGIFDEDDEEYEEYEEYYDDGDPYSKLECLECQRRIIGKYNKSK